MPRKSAAMSAMATIVRITRKTAKPTTARAATRSGSARTSCPCVEESGSSLFAAMRERLLEAGVVSGQERAGQEITGEEGQPDAAQSDRQDQVQRVDAER